MVVHLFATIAELKHRLRLPRSDLDVLRIVNLLSPRDWDFTLTFENDQLIMTATTSAGGDVSILIKGAIPSIFDGQELRLTTGRRAWKSVDPLNSSPLDSNVLTLADFGPTEADYVQLSIRSFARNRLPTAFSKQEDLRQYLLTHTWFGSGALPKGRYTVKFQVLGTPHRFQNQSLVDDEIAHARAHSIPTVTIEKVLGNPSIGRASFKTYARRKETSFRWTYSGVITSEEKTQWLGADRPGWLPGEIEITVQQSGLAPDGSFSLEGDVLQLPSLLRDFARHIPNDPKFQSYLRDCTTYEKEQSAKLIDRRKTELLATDFVFHRNIAVYKVPGSENELVSLHQKLEGMRALPFSEFTSLEYTAKLGIDAIVHYKLRATEALNKFATVEFEFHFESFFQHGHPVEQTNLIICWDKKGSAAVPQPVQDPNIAWLSHLTVDRHTIRVIEVSKYPDLTIKKLGEAPS